MVHTASATDAVAEKSSNAIFIPRTVTEVPPLCGLLVTLFEITGESNVKLWSCVPATAATVTNTCPSIVMNRAALQERAVVDNHAVVSHSLDAKMPDAVRSPSPNVSPDTVTDKPPHDGMFGRLPDSTAESNEKLSSEVPVNAETVKAMLAKER